MRAVWAVVVLICVMLMFLFPAGNGPFPAKYGPATPLRAKRAALLINISILVAAILTSACGAMLSFCRATASALPQPKAAQKPDLAVLGCVLLC